MSYKNETYRKAFAIKKREIQNAHDEYERRLGELRSRDPDFCELELELAKLGPAIAIAAISGEKEQVSELRVISDRLNAAYKDTLQREGIVKPEYFCPVCEDSGYANGDWCDCVKEIAKGIVAEELSRSMPIGNCSFKTFDLSYYPDEQDSDGTNPRKRAAAILSFCKDYVKAFPNGVRSVLFMGKTGLGKTHLSLSMVSEISAKGYSVVYGPAGKLFGAVEKEHFSYSGDTDKLDSLLQCDLLVIDDLGTEFLTPFTTSLFYNIVNSRILENRPTIISTNLSFDELESRYSNRIASRFVGSYDFKKLLGNDIRQIKAFE